MAMLNNQMAAVVRYQMKFFSPSSNQGLTWGAHLWPRALTSPHPCSQASYFHEIRGQSPYTLNELKVRSRQSEERIVDLASPWADAKGRGENPKMRSKNWKNISMIWNHTNSSDVFIIISLHYSKYSLLIDTIWYNESAINPME